MLAHELSHIANRDVLVMTVAVFFAMLAALLTRIGLYSGMFGGLGGNRDNNNSVPVWLIVLVVSVVTYFLSQILILAISRYREFAADRGSALITGAPEYLMSALQKIASQHHPDPAAGPARGRGDERVLHHPDQLAQARRRALHDAPAAREAAGRARRDLARDGPAGRVARVGLRDVLFGRKQLKDAAGERLFAISTARITLETELDLKPAGSAGVASSRSRRASSCGPRTSCSSCWTRSRSSRARRSSASPTSSASNGSSSATRTSRTSSRPCTWSRPSSSRAASAPQLLAAVFPFEGKGFDGGRVYWIYGFKRGAFWPFVPKGEGKERDNAEELELKAKLEQELPIEQDLTRWFGVFDAPV